MDKPCFRCLCVKPLAEFYRHAMMADGHLNKCKTCTKEDARQHRLANLEHIRFYDRQRASLPHRVAQRAVIYDAWKSANPDRRRAQVIVGDAIRAGRLARWPKCAVPTCDRRPEAHHPDYSQPLLVSWLCRPHHMQAHAINDEQEAA